MEKSDIEVTIALLHKMRNMREQEINEIDSVIYQLERIRSLPNAYK